MNTISQLKAPPQILIVIIMAAVVWALQVERRRVHRLEQAAGMKVIRVERGVFGETVYYAPGKPPSSDTPMAWSDVWGWVRDIWSDSAQPLSGSEGSR